MATVVVVVAVAAVAGALSELQSHTCTGASGRSNYLTAAVYAGALVNGNSGGTTSAASTSIVMWACQR